MSPIEIPEMLKKYGGFLTKGIIISVAPDMVKGGLVEILKLEKVDVAKATEWVNSNQSLWDAINPKYRERLKHLARSAGDLAWFNADWVINAIRDDLPVLASLFLGWKKAKNWLVRQVEIIKREVKK